MDNEELHPTALKVLYTLKTHADSEGVVESWNSILAREADLCRRQFIRWIRFLEEEGYIKTEMAMPMAGVAPKARRNKYTIL